jgi:hypothetical protein
VTGVDTAAFIAVHEKLSAAYGLVSQETIPDQSTELKPASTSTHSREFVSECRSAVGLHKESSNKPTFGCHNVSCDRTDHKAVACGLLEKL